MKPLMRLWLLAPTLAACTGPELPDDIAAALGDFDDPSGRGAGCDDIRLARSSEDRTLGLIVYLNRPLQSRTTPPEEEERVEYDFGSPDIGTNTAMLLLGERVLGHFCDDGISEEDEPDIDARWSLTGGQGTLTIRAEDRPAEFNDARVDFVLEDAEFTPEDPDEEVVTMGTLRWTGAHVGWLPG